MNWRGHPTKQQAVSDKGYRITWTENMHGVWYNAWTPEGRNIESGYNETGKSMCKAACIKHSEKVTA